MRLSSFINLGLIAVGAAASVKTLWRRQAWERSNSRAYIVLDYDDALAVSTRAGQAMDQFLCSAQRHGATHASLPELTLNRLLRTGRLAVAVPPSAVAGGDGRVYLAGADHSLLEHVLGEMCARAPGSDPFLLSDAAVPTLAVRGDLPTLAEMGLGFEAAVAEEILRCGLGVVPRPVSCAWPQRPLVERSLAQAAALGATVIAFEGDLILGHEMHLDATVESLQTLGLNYAYFCETRHQKGDWFVAKRLASAGQVILSHYFTPAAMVPEDFHSAAQHWGMLARQRGIRLCYVNVFRRIHATDPLECLHYLEHIREELQGQGLQFDGAPPKPLEAPERETLSLAGLAPAGSAALALTHSLNLPEPIALGLTALSAAGAAALPFFDRPRGRLEQAYPPSYAPKLLALAGAASAPAAAALTGDVSSVMLIQAGVAASLAALTTGRDYQMRIEEYRSLNLDLLLPIAALLLRRAETTRLRWLSLAVLAGVWYALRPMGDVLGKLNKDLPAGHTHHLSSAQRLAGDAVIALGPRPGRKWAGLGLAGFAVAGWLRRGGHKPEALAAEIVGTAASALMLAAFRQSERPLAETTRTVLRSWAGWGAPSLVVAALTATRLSGRYTDRCFD